jgi:hypothetical protein
MIWSNIVSYFFGKQRIGLASVRRAFSSGALRVVTRRHLTPVTL